MAETDQKLLVATERAFLHEVCNLMAVSQGHLHLLLMKVKKNPPELTPEDIIVRVEKILDGVEKLNKLVDDRRAIIQSEPNQSEAESQ